MEHKSENAVLDSGRRKFLIGAGLAAAAVATQFALVGLAGCKSDETTSPAAGGTPAQGTSSPAPTPAMPQGMASIPWKYASLDPVAAAERGYAAYYQGGCMYGAFESIVGELREKIGSPYDSFPTAMMKYGKGGVNSWGTLCGALNGAAASIYLVTEPKTGDPMIDELFAWYGAQGLPDYRPGTPKFDIKPSVSQSPLCHVSVTTWCETTGLKALSPERAERCAWLTASVAKHTAEMLNKWSAGGTAAMAALSSEVSGCLSCHGKGGVKENVHASKASSCTTCHEPHPLATH